VGNKHLVWRRQFGYGASVGIYAITNASTHVDNHTCAHTGTDDDHYGSAHASAHSGTNAGTHVDNHACAHTGTNDDHYGSAHASAHSGTNARTHVDVQLQWGALRRCNSLPIEVGLLRHIRLSLQRGVELEGSRLLRRRVHNRTACVRILLYGGVVHHRTTRVHILLCCIDARAQQLDTGTISGYQWQWHRGVVHAG